LPPRQQIAISGATQQVHEDYYDLYADRLINFKVRSQVRAVAQVRHGFLRRQTQVRLPGGQLQVLPLLPRVLRGAVLLQRRPLRVYDGAQLPEKAVGTVHSRCAYFRTTMPTGSSSRKPQSMTPPRVPNARPTHIEPLSANYNKPILNSFLSKNLIHKFITFAMSRRKLPFIK